MQNTCGGVVQNSILLPYQKELDKLIHWFKKYLSFSAASEAKSLETQRRHDLRSPFYRTIALMTASVAIYSYSPSNSTRTIHI